MNQVQKNPQPKTQLPIKDPRRFTNLNAVMVDNYDSFTFNLVQYFQELGVIITTVRNDEESLADLVQRDPDFFVISPGPSDPQHAGVCLDLVKHCADSSKPLLGVCLGHQCIGEAFGAAIVRAPSPVHGKQAEVHHQETGIFAKVDTPFIATRYHSLVIDPATLPDAFEVTAHFGDIIMAVQHRKLPIHGVQFHPESVLTPQGHSLLANFCELVDAL